MLLDCYFIDDEGEEAKIPLEKVRMTHKSLALIISHRDRLIYIFKGTKTTTRQKFAGARSASIKRLDLGYKIKHIEEESGIDESFNPILEFFGGIKTPLKREAVEVPNSTPRKHRQIVETMMELEPLEKATCECLLVVNDCFE